MLLRGWQAGQGNGSAADLVIGCVMREFFFVGVFVEVLGKGPKGGGMGDAVVTQLPHGAFPADAVLLNPSKAPFRLSRTKTLIDPSSICSCRFSASGISRSVDISVGAKERIITMQKDTSGMTPAGPGSDCSAKS